MPISSKNSLGHSLAILFDLFVDFVAPLDTKMYIRERAVLGHFADSDRLLRVGGATDVALYKAKGEVFYDMTPTNIKKIITIAGNLDHVAWTTYHRLPPLSDSLNAADYKSRLANIPQIHYIGTEDKIIPPELSHTFADHHRFIEVQGATHNDGWDVIYHLIWQEQ